MRTKKIFLGFTAILAVGVTTAACSGDDDDDGGSGNYTLESGDYGLNITDVPVATNSCFPSPQGDDLIALLTSIELPVEIISSNGTSFSIIIPDVADEIIPSVSGTITGNDLAAGGNAPGLVVTTGCTMSVSATVDAVLTGDNQFDLTGLVADFSVPASDAAACAPLVGQTIPGTEPANVPWPALTNGSSGTCSITLVGEGQISE